MKRVDGVVEEEVWEILLVEEVWRCFEERNLKLS